MANTFSVPQKISFESLDLWKNTPGFARKFDKKYSKQFGKAGDKIGSNYTVRKPVYFSVANGLALSVQAIVETTTNIVLAIVSQVSYQIDDVEMLLKVDDMMERYGVPAVAALSANVDAQSGIFAAIASPNYVGTLGTLPSTNDLWLDAGTLLDDYNAQDDGDRNLVVTPKVMKKAVQIDQTLFNNQNVIGDEFKKGVRRDDVHGFNWQKSQVTPIFTTGNYAGTPAVNGANQTGTSLIVNGLTANGSFKQGDKFQIASLNAVNMQTKQDIGRLKQFTITANTPIDGSGNATLPIFPAIISTGSPYQNVVGAPANGSLLQMWAPGNTKGTLNLGFTKDAFALTFGKLAVPDGNVEKGASETDPDTGISLRYTMSWDVNTSSHIVRWDALWSPNGVVPEHSVVLMS